MKKFLINILAILYVGVSLLILLAAITFPFQIGMKGAWPMWTAWVIYPMAIVVCASQAQILSYFDSK